MLNLKKIIKNKKRLLVSTMAIGLLLSSGVYAKEYAKFKFTLTTYYQRSPAVNKTINGSSSNSTNAGAFVINTEDYTTVRGVIRLQDSAGNTNYSNGYTHPAKARRTYANSATAGTAYTFVVRNHADDSAGGNFEGFWSPDNY